jgi:hypothetical protein
MSERVLEIHSRYTKLERLDEEDVQKYGNEW